MDTYRERKPGSVRLNDEQYEEMELLGLENESQYLRYKLNEATPMHVSRSYDNNHQTDNISDKLALQRAELENERLREKLSELSRNQEEALSGVNNHVSQLLQEELMKRDFEALKKESAQQTRQIEKLESKLKRAEDQVDEKDSEIAELVRKLGIIELGKALIPGAVSGLAKRYPKQLQGLAETLGELGGQMAALPESSQSLTEEQQELIEFAEYFQSLFEEDQLQEIVLLLGQISEALKADDTTIQKMTYYLNHLGKVRKANANQSELNEENENKEINHEGI
ncbi:hypothetical protein C900_02342 [Fulvivirga imtechensis AK7]|uniref:Uncharacterized protein n=1 Tax=Fulvivirga imtechensis AK7 TaxID=1237149 RepID=L8JX33_9BACT|nr:hypothetical protein [Fulvivirga imtechensis]ELR71757.1 hypothetical protein C900_02342 [Fulvivirga imtechensis AK7]